MPLPTQTAPAAPATGYLRDSYLFEWHNLSLGPDLIFVLAVAICLAAGIATGHPTAGMIAAGGAVTTGFGGKHTIDDSRLLPMIFVAVGIAGSTFVGMVAGYAHFLLVPVVVLWGFGCGMLSSRPSGYEWVGQQCVVFLLVASAFPFSPREAALRAAVTLAGGAMQIVCSSVLLRLLSDLRRQLLSLARYVRTEELLLRSTIMRTAQSLRPGSSVPAALPYALRLAITLGVGTEIYIRMPFSGGYWIPMTALLVLKPGVTDTASRAIARTLGTIAGAVVVTLFLTHFGFSVYSLAGYTVLFAWFTYGTVDVNYALFSIFLTSYVVSLLSLAGISGQAIAERRALCTAIGGALALTVRLVVIGHRKRVVQRRIAAAP